MNEGFKEFNYGVVGILKFIGGGLFLISMGIAIKSRGIQGFELISLATVCLGFFSLAISLVIGEMAANLTSLNKEFLKLDKENLRLKKQLEHINDKSIANVEE